MVELLCTSCSDEKRRDPNLLPALERYRSPRIHGLAVRSRRLGRRLVILSGEYGLLDPDTVIPWYDHALEPAEAAGLAARVAEQLTVRRASRVTFYAEPEGSPGWTPYHRVLERACKASGAALVKADAETELVGRRPDLADRLFHLVDADEEARQRLAATGELFDGYAPEMEAVHRKNAAALEAILDAPGSVGVGGASDDGRWPGRTRVGAEGARAAWLVAQHAISLPDFQRRCRELLERAVAEGEALARHHVQLVDRIRFNERRPQLYGTLLDWDRDGRLSPWPIERQEEVDARRRRVGLVPLSAAIVEARRRAEAEGDRPPASFAARQREIERWSRAVGWLTTTRP